MKKEASSRILINELLKESGWKFQDDENGHQNILLENRVTLGNQVENQKKGFVDYTLLGSDKKPLVVIEAKQESIHPLTAKEQARMYAISIRAKYIILSNGYIHYFWNYQKGNPEIITSFPTLESLESSKALNNSSDELVNVDVDKFYIATSQDPLFNQTAEWKNKNEEVIIENAIKNGIRILRDYQILAVKSIQSAIKEGKTRFLLEMATGTGKTLTAAAIIKLFIRSNVANRILFLVDRLELENQAMKDFTHYLSKDGIKVDIYKENKDSWYSADIVISTIQSFSYENKFQKIFTPSDFDLVISDEAHRSLGTSNRAILEYFLGYKLGLTATPKNYLKGVDFELTDPREIERRQLLDTYTIFGCSSGNPTFSYTLNDGVQDKILISPKVIDARTDITSELLSSKGLRISLSDEDESQHNELNEEIILLKKDFEKTFFSDSTNKMLVKTFIENAKKDPITNEIGKSIIYCVNIEHARKVTEILNEQAFILFGNKYNSDFAVQITSNIPNAQQMTINFANNNLNGKTRWLEDYESSKTRIVVTVGMMTTGYDCPDLLNIAIFRPIFSPSEFIQIKGRGTRLNKFKYEHIEFEKDNYYLFDFFAVSEYFENDFNYDDKIEVHYSDSRNILTNDEDFFKTAKRKIINDDTDNLKSINTIDIGISGMKIDRKFYQGFEQKMLQDLKVIDFIERQDMYSLETYLKEEIFDKPIEYYTVKKIENSLGLGRRLTIREIVLKLLGKISKFKNKDEIILEEFNNFILLNKEQLSVHLDKSPSMKNLFEAYLIDDRIRNAVKEKKYHILINSQLSKDLRITKDIMINNMRFIEYVREYVIINDINCDKFN